MKELPTGTQSFSILRKNDYIYVDKTKFIYEMIKNGRVYFLSRPRRFGKSLLVSTLAELFKGNKDLFKGLYIYDKWKWDEECSVIYLDFGNIGKKNPDILEDSLNSFLMRIARNYKIELISNDLSGKFSELIEEIYKSTGKKLVVLIDEYDLPIISCIKDVEVADKNRAILSDFYQVLKASDEYLRFIFLTGVSKFSKTSIFSGLNNLKDITLNDNYACICGYTHQELKKYFKDHLNALKCKLSLSDDELFSKIDYWYDGYSWDGENNVYNPFSTLNLFEDKKFSNFWFETGTPELLIKVLKNADNYEEVLEPMIVKESRFKTFNYDKIDPIAIFFQTGYLTIVEEMIINDIIHYKLEFPNFEVENSLLDCLIDLNLSQESTHKRRERILSYIKKIDNDSFQKEMKAFLSRIPSRLHIEREAYYHSIFLAWLYASGFEVEGETPTNTGFTDMILKEEDFIVVAEFKFSKLKKGTDSPVKSYDTMLKEAITQIKNKKYYEKYIDKKIIAIAIAFAGKQLQTQITRIK